jgi:hypothetical protein
MSELDDLRVLVDLRDRTLQKSRIAFGNRIAAIEGGNDDAGPEMIELLARWHERLLELEREADKDIARLAAHMPIIKEAVKVKGCGFVNVAKVIALMGGISSFETVSQLWRFAGYAVIDGQAERLRKGEKAHFNRRLKTACWLLATGLMRANSPYRREYDAARERYEMTHAEWTDGHKHNAALRKMVKLWLSHLWEAWRELEGLPTRPPYALEYLKHNTHKSRFEYGWLGS